MNNQTIAFLVLILLAFSFNVYEVHNRKNPAPAMNVIGAAMCLVAFLAVIVRGKLGTL